MSYECPKCGHVMALAPLREDWVRVYHREGRRHEYRYQEGGFARPYRPRVDAASSEGRVSE